SSVRRLDLPSEVRLIQLAPVGDRRVRHGHLQRRDQQEALADGEVHAVTREPAVILPEYARVPLVRGSEEGLGGDAPGLLSGEIDSGPLAEAHLEEVVLHELLRLPRAEVLEPEVESELVEDRVAGDDQ